MQDNIIKRRGTILAISVIALLVLSPLFYMIITQLFEDTAKSFLDGFFWTVATVSTMGAPEALTLESDVGKLYTVIIVFIGIAIFFIGFPFFIIGPWLEEQVKKATSPEHIPLPEKNHVIVCGYTEIGEEVIDDLELHNIPYILIDTNKDLGEKLIKSKTPFIVGDARDADILKKANINRAFSLVTAESDTMNPIICLTARSIRPDIRIISSVHDEEHEEVLTRAGATKVVSPRASSGALLANLALSRYDVDIKGKISLFGKMHIWQHPISRDSPLKDMTLNQAKIREKTGVTVIGLWKQGTLIINPSASEPLPVNCILVTIGSPSQLAQLRNLLTGEDQKVKKKKKEERHQGGSD
jgi:Trk K+ transport system NAD-binding subunit